MEIKTVVDDGGRSQAGYWEETEDCVVRATAIVSGLPYQHVHHFAREVGRKDRNPMQRELVESLWSKLGLNIKVEVPINLWGGLCLGDVAELLDKGHYLILIRGHIFAFIDGVVHDTGVPSSEIHHTRVYAIYQVVKELAK